MGPQCLKFLNQTFAKYFESGPLTRYLCQVGIKEADLELLSTEAMKVRHLLCIYLSDALKPKKETCFVGVITSCHSYIFSIKVTILYFQKKMIIPIKMALLNFPKKRWRGFWWTTCVRWSLRMPISFIQVLSKLDWINISIYIWIKN